MSPGPVWRSASIDDWYSSGRGADDAGDRRLWLRLRQRQRAGHVARLEQLAEIEHEPQGAPPRPEEREVPLGHHAERVDRHDREGDDHRLRRPTHLVPHLDEAEFHLVLSDLVSGC
jgi:hypothetical protein